MLLIYSTLPAPRLRYICNVLLHDTCGIEPDYTHSKDDFFNYSGPKINYSDTAIAEDEFRIPPASLLFENTIKAQTVPVLQLKEYPVLYPAPEGDWTFDIFAGAFYLLSRYEEYLSFTPDEYGRFAYTESIAFRNDFLQLPLINYWLSDFQQSLQRKFPSLVFPAKKFCFIPTYDIDIAYSYLHKGIIRNAGGLMRSLLRGRLAEVKERIDVLTKRKDDPFDVYEWLYALHLKYQLQPYYFFLVTKSTGGYDKNIDPLQAEMQELIRYHASGYQVGVHPSWQSGDDETLLDAEIETMESITGQKIVNSRQHYIRFHLPRTYRQLINAGIRNEFSMGYGSINGFRASIASPFYWYDLEKEEKTSLEIHPFCFMDANAYYEQMLSPQQAFEQIRYYHDVIKKVNGTMITIWHNNFFGSDKMFKGWKEVYELFLKEVVYWDL
ncbi:MAG: polysaccharide deacetylase family protein [Chitinophagaceae bacterium]|nr:polysaccharide deacetylase family protein [Chitinophagaceae bacterium]